MCTGSFTTILGVHQARCSLMWLAGRMLTEGLEVDRRLRTRRGGAWSRLTAVILVAMTLFTVTGLALAASVHRPHMGARSSEQGTVYWNPLRNQWTVYRWGGCRTVVYWYIDPTISSSWTTAITNAVSKWDNSGYCSPDFIKTASSNAARLKFRNEADGAYCGADFAVRAWYAVACRNYANSSTDQLWTVAFNGREAFGVGASSAFDVESIALNEMGHVVYLDHNTTWTSGTVQANSCKWGTNIMSSDERARILGLRAVRRFM